MKGEGVPSSTPSLGTCGDLDGIFPRVSSALRGHKSVESAKHF